MVLKYVTMQMMEHLCLGQHDESIIERLESDTLTIAELFPNNCMKLNEDKCRLMVFGDKSNDISLNIGCVRLKESRDEWLL